MAYLKLTEKYELFNPDVFHEPNDGDWNKNYKLERISRLFNWAITWI